jgi:hypothetical protein
MTPLRTLNRSAGNGMMEAEWVICHACRSEALLEPLLQQVTPFLLIPGPLPQSGPLSQPILWYFRCTPYVEVLQSVEMRRSWVGMQPLEQVPITRLENNFTTLRHYSCTLAIVCKHTRRVCQLTKLSNARWAQPSCCPCLHLVNGVGNMGYRVSDCFSGGKVIEYSVNFSSNS